MTESHPSRRTLLVYLNDVPEGGRTSFRDLRAGGTDDAGKPLRLMVAPQKGRAILFCPAAADGVPDDRTLHAGEPTAQGEDKWIAQVRFQYSRRCGRCCTTRGAQTRDPQTLACNCSPASLPLVVPLARLVVAARGDLWPYGA